MTIYRKWQHFFHYFCMGFLFVWSSLKTCLWKTSGEKSRWSVCMCHVLPAENKERRGRALAVTSALWWSFRKCYLEMNEWSGRSKEELTFHMEKQFVVPRTEGWCWKWEWWGDMKGSWSRVDLYSRDDCTHQHGWKSVSLLSIIKAQMCPTCGKCWGMLDCRERFDWPQESPHGNSMYTCMLLFMLKRSQNSKSTTIQVYLHTVFKNGINWGRRRTEQTVVQNVARSQKPVIFLLSKSKDVNATMEFALLFCHLQYSVKMFTFHW